MMTEGVTARKRGVSRAAQQAVAEAVHSARPRVLDELGWLLSSRGGRASSDQVAAAAAVVSHLAEPDAVVGTLAHWLELHDGDPGAAWSWAESAPGAALLAAALLGGLTRRDPTTRELAELWQPTTDEARALDLRCIVTEAQRSRARRRAEGVAARPTAGEQPWVAAGVSRATYYRRQADRETPATIQVERTRARDMVAGVSRPDWTPRTAAGRRYLARALQLGVALQADADSDEPRSWLLCDPVHEALLSDDLTAAVAAQERRSAILRSQSRREPPWTPPDPKARPARVSVAVWETVPPNLRERVVRRTARLFLGGVEPDEAMRLALTQVSAEPEPPPRLAPPPLPEPDVMEIVRARRLLYGRCDPRDEEAAARLLAQQLAQGRSGSYTDVTAAIAAAARERGA